MPNTLKFAFILHNHQPVGNDESVLEESYRQCYEPFLGIVERHPRLKFVLHYSGTLLEWLVARHPDFFPRLRALREAGRIEILGGGFGEPILVMLPDRDRVGQLTFLSDYVEKKFGGRPRGMWMTERVWEQDLVQSIAGAGLEYTAVDDSHFKRAGLGNLDLFGSFLTEDRGSLLRVFPLDERLRYVIPYAKAEEAIAYLKSVADGGTGRVIVFGDDGEKFGVWPKSYKHCYEDAWLERFFSLVEANSSWLESCTLAEAVDALPPRGKIYLPDASYREMAIWQLPPQESRMFQELVKAAREGRSPVPEMFLAAGNWRNFRVKYPESNDMYTKMLAVSRKVDALSPQSRNRNEAHLSLYRGQCNCPYWHGVFGGLYLSHLRAATYRELLNAESLADASRLGGKEVRIESEDRNLDGRLELIVTTKKSSLVFAPAYGGHLYEWGLYRAKHNLLATLTRRPEAYHGHTTSDGKEWKPEEGGITEFLYDWYKRESLIDHFFGPNANLESLVKCRFPEDGDFVDQPFEAQIIEQKDGKAVLELQRSGNIWHQGKRMPVQVNKQITFDASTENLGIHIRITNPGTEIIRFHYGSEWNIAFSEGDAPQRDLFTGPKHKFISNLGSPRELQKETDVRLMDGWLGIKLDYHFEKPADIWTFPVRTLSQSESGFDENYQGTSFIPRWTVDLAPGKEWETNYEIKVTIL